MAMGAAAAGATARASIQVADRSSVDRNTALLMGAIAAGGEGSLAIQLAASNVTGNKLSGGVAVALGGAGSTDITGVDARSVVVTGNENEARFKVVTENQLAAKTLSLIMSLGELEGRGELSWREGASWQTLAGGGELAGRARGKP